MKTGNSNHTLQLKNIITKGTKFKQILDEKFVWTEEHLSHLSMPMCAKIKKHVTYKASTSVFT